MIQRQALIPESLNGQRCDRAAVKLFSEFSRSRLQSWISCGDLLVDGKTLRSKDPVFSGMQMTLETDLVDQERWEAEDLDINLVYEDEQILVVDKPVGLVVHPGAGNPSGTLLNGLLFHFPEVNKVPRGGIVHRIDKDTSGLMVVAKTIQAQTSLVAQLSEHTVKREYEAITQGVITAGGTIDAPIGRHSTARVKMALVSSGKPAVTHYRIKQKFAAHTHIQVQLETGRTHQIRVHMASKRFPLVGDAIYTGRPRLPKRASFELKEALQNFSRQALHAAKLALTHPNTGEQMEWQSPLPEDMENLLAILRTDLDEDS